MKKVKWNLRRKKRKKKYMTMKKKYMTNEKIRIE